MKELVYKGYILTINELPNFDKDGEWYRGISFIDGEKWVRDSSMVYLLESWFQSHIDNLYKDKTYEQICHVWGSNYKRVDYKGRWLSITARKRAKDNRVVYLGEFCSKDYKCSKSIESIHYDKVISKFERFVNEYCTDWKTCSSIPYKGYMLSISEDIDKENFFGVCKIHKNSTFKCISKSYREIEDKFITRIDQILYHKQGVKVVSSKEDRLKQLEAQIAALQQEFEKVKKEKDILIYKGVTLEYGVEGDWMVGRIKNAPEGTKKLEANHEERMKEEFEKYINELEKAHRIYEQLMEY